MIITKYKNKTIFEINFSMGWMALYLSDTFDQGTHFLWMVGPINRGLEGEDEWTFWGNYVGGSTRVGIWKDDL